MPVPETVEPASKPPHIRADLWALTFAGLLNRYHVAVLKDQPPYGTRQTNREMNDCYEALTARAALSSSETVEPVPAAEVTERVDLLAKIERLEKRWGVFKAAVIETDGALRRIATLADEMGIPDAASMLRQTALRMYTSVQDDG